MSSSATSEPPPPAVSVLIAVHDGEAYLEVAMRSIMSQTLENIEIVVVDDASTDATPAILARLAAEDPRIRVARLETNRRLAAALNHGLALVRAPYVARMDADDIAYPDRLAVQKRYLDAHPEVILVGASVERIDADGRLLWRSHRPRDGFCVRWLARFSLTIQHPTFMFRRTAPDGTALAYDPARPLSQDHAFVCRALDHGAVVCLAEVLLKYRVHGGAVTRTKATEQRRHSREICTAFQARELPGDIFDALAAFRDCYFGLEPVAPGTLGAVFAGARAMRAHDGARHPERRAWISRQLAQLLLSALQRGRLGKSAIALAFLRHGPDFLMPLALRALEIRRLMPRALSSDPDV